MTAMTSPSVIRSSQIALTASQQSSRDVVDGPQLRPPGEEPLPRRFALHRPRDPTGVSGTGLVAFGTVYPSGRTTLAWCVGDVASVTVYDSADQVLQIHGHDGAAELVWIDGPDRQRLDVPTSLPGRDAVHRM
jgi:hypothetical protein